MKKSEIVTAVEAGKLVVVGDFRDWEVRELPNRTWNGSPNVIESTYVAFGRDVAQFDKFLPKGSNIQQAQRPAWKPGQRVACEVTEIGRTKWGTRARGVVTAYEG